MKIQTFSTLMLALAGAGFSTLGVAQMNHGSMQGNSKAMPTPHSTDSVMVEGLVKDVGMTVAKFELVK
ncbi:MAG: hypothetical protein ACOYNF_03965 [Rhodoferax sp.]